MLAPSRERSRLRAVFAPVRTPFARGSRAFARGSRDARAPRTRSRGFTRRSRATTRRSHAPAPYSRDFAPRIVIAANVSAESSGAEASSAARSRASDDVVLALDQGGQSSRAIAYDASGRAVASSSVAVTERREGADRVEQDPEEIASSLAAAASDVVRAIGRSRRILCAGLATQRSSLVCWDRASGEPLSPVLSWQDRRAADRLQRVARDAEEIHRRTGLFVSPHYGASKIAWCLEELPEVARARDRGTLAVGPLASWLAFRLLRERPLVADPANASRTLLASIAARDWDPWLCERFGVPVAILPRCVPTQFEFGTLMIEGAAIPLRALTGDQSAAIFADGEPRADAVYVNLGTGAFVQRAFAGELVLLPRLLTSVVRTSVAGAPTFVVEGTINGAGSALREIGAELGVADVEAHLDKWLRAQRGTEIFLNGVSGLAAPYWAPSFRSRFVDIGSADSSAAGESSAGESNTRRSIAGESVVGESFAAESLAGESVAAERIAAVAESVLFLVKIILDEMETALPRARVVRASGGLSRSDALCARLAVLCGVPVERALDAEATARGLAWQLFDASKQHVARATWSTASFDTFAPRANASLAERHARFRAELERALGL
jgi:glycerol kinase